MPEQGNTEQAIREALAAETSAIELSNKLFRPDGLFAQLASTEEERRALAGSPLFAEAQRRLSDLQRQEGADFSWAVAQARPLIPETSLVLQLAKAGVEQTC
jgi:hypothetical protein